MISFTLSTAFCVPFPPCCSGRSASFPAGRPRSDSRTAPGPCPSALPLFRPLSPKFSRLRPSKGDKIIGTPLKREFGRTGCPAKSAKDHDRLIPKNLRFPRRPVLKNRGGSGHPAAAKYRGPVLSPCRQGNPDGTTSGPAAAPRSAPLPRSPAADAPKRRPETPQKRRPS